MVNNVSNNTIGGNATEDRNLFGNNDTGIVINGTSASGNLVEGNYIGTDGSQLLSERNGVSIGEASDNVIGGTTVGAGNVIAGDNAGVVIGGDANKIVSGNLVEGNYIGLKADGTEVIPGLGYNGVTLSDGTANIIGGISPSARNVIAGWDGQGVVTEVAGDPGSGGEIVEGNYIGTNAAGSAALVPISPPYPFETEGVWGGGVYGGNLNAVISNNLISGQDFGIYDAWGGLTVQGNKIGTDASGTRPIPNGVGIQIASTIEPDQIGGTTPGAGNIVAFNEGDAISVVGTTGVQIEGNSIHDNAGLGIDLGSSGTPVLNDSQGHNGPNNYQNFPVLSSASSSSTDTSISGTFSEAAEPDTSITLDFYANPAAAPSGFGQAQTYLGSTTVTTDANGSARFTASGLAALPASQDYLSATATDPNGNTSEFSQDLDLLLTSPTVTQSGGSTAVSFTLRNDPTKSYTINWGDNSSPQTIAAGQSSASHVYTAAGVYQVQATAQNQGSAPPATALVLISTQASDQLSISGGSSPGQVAVTDTALSLSQTYSPTNFVVASGSGGSDTYTVNFGSNLTTPLAITGDGATSGSTVDTLIVNGDGSNTNVINKTAGQITWGSPVTETVYRSGIADTTINANGTSTNYVNDPGGGTTINGGPGTNYITITATTGSGVVLNGGPHANNYIIDMGNLAGPVTINSTTGTSTLTVNGPSSGSNTLTLSSTQLTGDGETINLNLGSTATNVAVAGGGGNNQLVVQGTPPGPLTVQSVAPTVGAITAPSAPTSLGTAISASAAFSDLDGDNLTAVWNWGDNTTTSQTLGQYGTSGTVTASHTYAAAGVYTVTLTLTDAANANLSGQSTFQYVVIYDASAGFTTGGGWFNSPAGADAAKSTLTGKAIFGFTAKYHSGSTVPTGQTVFLFPAANLYFLATSYDWLVINGSQAQYQGSGTINLAGNYGFLVTVADNDASRGPDAIRIQIWNKNNNNAVVYDTQPGAAITAAPTTLLGGGDIQVHANTAQAGTAAEDHGSTTTSGTSQPAPLPGSSDSSNLAVPGVTGTPAASADSGSSNAGSWLAFEANLLDVWERDLSQWENAMMHELASLTQTVDQLFADWERMALDSFGAIRP